jgi:hypothetical protein
MWAAEVSSKCKPPNSGTNSSNCSHLRTIRAAINGLLHNRRTLSLTARQVAAWNILFSAQRASDLARAVGQIVYFTNCFSCYWHRNVSADSRQTSHIAVNLGKEAGKLAVLARLIALYLWLEGDPEHRCVEGSKSFRPGELFKVTGIKQLRYFPICSPFIFNTFHICVEI